jgi:hypothetical protein
MSGITTTASNKPVKDQDIENQNIWLSDLMKEYSELLDELTYDNSPNSRQKKSRYNLESRSKEPTTS